VIPEQLDGEALSAHAAVMPAPESAAAMDATAIALAVRPLRNISGPFLAMAAQGQSTLKPSGPYSVNNLPNRRPARDTREAPCTTRIRKRGVLARDNTDVISCAVREPATPLPPVGMTLPAVEPHDPTAMAAVSNLPR
jgi:hypothetical protein